MCRWPGIVASSFESEMVSLHVVSLMRARLVASTCDQQRLVAGYVPSTRNQMEKHVQLRTGSSNNTKNEPGHSKHAAGWSQEMCRWPGIVATSFEAKMMSFHVASPMRAQLVASTCDLQRLVAGYVPSTRNQ